MISFTLREGFNKKMANYPLLVDKRFTPPVIHLGEIINIHIKEIFYPPSLTPPLALIHFYPN